MCQSKTSGPKLNITGRFATFKRKLSEKKREFSNFWKLNHIYTGRELCFRLGVAFLAGWLISAMMIGCFAWLHYTDTSGETPATENLPLESQSLTGSVMSIPTPRPTLTRTPEPTSEPTATAEPTPALTPIVSYSVMFGVTGIEGEAMTGILDETYYCTCTETDTSGIAGDNVLPPVDESD